MTSLATVLLLLAASGVLAAPTVLDREYQVVTEKRAALVLDRLLVALRQALQDGVKPDATLYQSIQRDTVKTDPTLYQSMQRDGPSAAPLRIAPLYHDMSALERRGQSPSGRGRVLRCFFNAITCF